MIVLGDDDAPSDELIETPDAVDLMFQTMYSGRYQIKAGAEAPETEPDGRHLDLHAKAYALGEKYEISLLKDVARAQFEEDIEQGWDEDAFRAASHTVYTTTPAGDTGLRELVVQVLNWRAQQSTISEAMREFIRECPDLSFSLWENAVSSSPGPPCETCNTVELRQCHNCGRGKSKKPPAKRCFVSCRCSLNRTLCDDCLERSAHGWSEPELF